MSLAGQRIGLLTASASRLGGGVFEAVVTQAEMIREQGGEALVFALSDAHSIEDASRFAPGTVTHLPITGPAQIGFAPALAERLLAADLDCLHLHGIWMYPSRAGTIWARTTGRPYLISPHGMLDPWITSRGRAKKAAARLGYERASWRAARVIHALTGQEAADIARESGRRDSLIIPNSGPPAALPTQAPRPPHVVYLGRIHPKKNLSALIEGWRLAASAVEASGARLTIAGWGEDAHVAQLRATLADAPPSIEFIGPAFGEAKARLLRDARFFVLPSLSEGLPMAVLEGWAAATPMLMSRGCNLDEGFAAGAALDCGMTSDTITACLTTALAMPHEQWQSMAHAAHALAATRFSREHVAAQWAAAYHALIEGRTPEAPPVSIAA